MVHVFLHVQLLITQIQIQDNAQHHSLAGRYLELIQLIHAKMYVPLVNLLIEMLTGVMHALQHA
jgi:hypothetical protein